MLPIEAIERLSQQEVASGTFLRDYLRGVVRASLTEIMAEEVLSLCGGAYERNSENREYRRAGSTPSGFEFDGERLKRPRVRKKTSRGEEEHTLSSYEAAKEANREELQEAILRMYTAGVSGREVREAVDWNRGASRSEVSRLWIEKGAEYITELQDRDLSADRWVALMVDGVVLSGDLTAVIALGINESGAKKVLGFAIGCSENSETCQDLISQIRERGFDVIKGNRLLAVTDGSKAIRRAITGAWPDAVVQRCLVHKERNIRAKLSRKHHGELARLFRNLRMAQNSEDAAEAVKALRQFLKKKSAQGLASLEEAGEDLAAFFDLGVANTLNLTFLSTNIIENAIRNTRRKTGRVSRWRENTDQPSRWVAYALLTAERGFRKIKGYLEMPQLVKALTKPDANA